MNPRECLCKSRPPGCLGQLGQHIDSKKRKNRTKKKGMRRQRKELNLKKKSDSDVGAQ